MNGKPTEDSRELGGCPEKNEEYAEPEEGKEPDGSVKDPRFKPDFQPLSEVFNPEEEGAVVVEELDAENDGWRFELVIAPGVVKEGRG